MSCKTLPNLRYFRSDGTDKTGSWPQNSREYINNTDVGIHFSKVGKVVDTIILTQFQPEMSA